MKRVSSLFLLAALLFAQGALLAHEYDFAIHQSTGDNCHTCLQASPLNHAASGWAIVAVPAVMVRPVYHAPSIRGTSFITIAYSARAPPVVSSV